MFCYSECNASCEALITGVIRQLLSPLQRLPLGIPIKIAVIKKSKAQGDVACENIRFSSLFEEKRMFSQARGDDGKRKEPLFHSFSSPSSPTFLIFPSPQVPYDTHRKGNSTY